jgi:hypothetical protein
LLLDAIDNVNCLFLLDISMVIIPTNLVHPVIPDLFAQAKLLRLVTMEPGQSYDFGDGIGGNNLARSTLIGKFIALA